MNIAMNEIKADTAYLYCEDGYEPVPVHVKSVERDGEGTSIIVKSLSDTNYKQTPTAPFPLKSINMHEEWTAYCAHGAEMYCSWYLESIERKAITN